VHREYRIISDLSIRVLAGTPLLAMDQSP